MDKLLNRVGSMIRGWMLVPAKLLQKVSGGRITPNHVTLVSFLGHFIVVWALYNQKPILGALALAFFGLMDSLDGALARLQKTASLRGMFYDAVSDRAKEIIVYIGIVFYLKQSYYLPNGLTKWLIDTYQAHGVTELGWIVVAVCGFSLLISYIKAKGEVAFSANKNHDPQVINKIFADGIARYEIRMSVLIAGLVFGRLFIALHILLLLVLFTVVQRLIRISRALKDV